MVNTCFNFENSRIKSTIKTVMDKLYRSCTLPCTHPSSPFSSLLPFPHSHLNILSKRPHPIPIYPLPPCSTSFATLASIFLLAARIISSLLFCKSACLSFLLELQAAPPPCFCFDSRSSASRFSACSSASLAFRLYRVIKSGWVGLEDWIDVEEAAAGAGSGGWKD